MESFCLIGIKIFRNSWDQSNHSLFVAFYDFDEAKVILVDATFDSNPLMLLKSLLIYDFAPFHDLCHFIDRNHRYGSEIDTAKSLEYFLDMLRLVSFAVNYSRGEFRLEDFKHIQRIAHVQVIDELVRDFEYKLSFFAWGHLNPPKF